MIFMLTKSIVKLEASFSCVDEIVVSINQCKLVFNDDLMLED